MDLIFQSGEFYNQESTIASIFKLLLPLLGAVISGAIAVWIFNKGIKKRREEEEEKEKRRLDELKVYFLTFLRLLEKPINVQIMSYLRFSSNLKHIEDINYAPTYEVSLNTRSFKSIDRKDLYKIFVTNRTGSPTAKAALFQQLITQIDYIKVTEKDFKKLFKYFISKLELYSKSWEDNINKISQLKDTMTTNARQNRVGEGEDIFLEELDRLFYEWAQTKEYRQRYVAAYEFLMPLQYLCRKHNNDQRAIDILHYCNNSLFAFDNINHLKDFVREGTIKCAWGLRNVKVTTLVFLDIAKE